MIESSFVITGPARCGTHWVARVLEALAIDAWHEAAFRPATLSKWDTFPPPGTNPIKILRDSVGTAHEGEVSWLAAPYLPLFDLAVPVVHLIRDPLETAKSLQGRLFDPTREGFEHYAKAARRHMGDTTRLKAEIDLCLHYWWKWNHLVEPRAFHRVGLEELSSGTDAWVEMLDKLGLHRNLHEIEEVLGRDLERNASKEPHHDLQWTDFSIPWLNEIQAMATRYGYA